MTDQNTLSPNQQARTASFLRFCDSLRHIIQHDANSVDMLFSDHKITLELSREIGANLKLAYRHLEDARMRLGKAMQHAQGGESIYNKLTPEQKGY